MAHNEATMAYFREIAGAMMTANPIAGREFVVLLDKFDAMEGALKAAETQFLYYADLHAKAGKSEKADTNLRFAYQCRAALTVAS